jgi:AAA family ATP:ADP antiporter
MLMLRGLVHSSPTQRWIDVRAGERGVLAWSFLFFFCLLGGYYVLRPVRDALAVSVDRDHLRWMFTGTFVAMLLALPVFGALVARYPRRRFVPWVYRFFFLNLLIFAALIHLDAGRVVVAYAFYIWASVYNMFVVSLFWSVMVDVFRSDQGKRLFGMIAAGGSVGALVGSQVTTMLAEAVGLAGLLLVSGALLEVAVQCFFRVTRAQGDHPSDAVTTPAGPAPAAAPAEPGVIGGGVLAGVVAVARSPYLAGICLYVIFMATVQTFLYMQRADIVRVAFTSDEARAAFFGQVDLMVNLATLLLQTLVTARILRWLGVGAALASLPAFAAAGFAGLIAAPVLAMLVACEAALRASTYAIGRPAREVLFTVVSREQKYKSKSFIDTVVYRFGDMVASWGESGLHALGLGLVGVAVVTMPLAGVWLGCALLLGRAHEVRARASASAGAVPAPPEIVPARVVSGSPSAPGARRE